MCSVGDVQDPSDRWYRRLSYAYGVPTTSINGKKERERFRHERAAIVG